jgi:hypothetical protein
VKRGDFVLIERGEVKMEAMITLASPNGVSLMVMFDGMFCGFVNMMPLLRDENGVYRDLIEHKPVKLSSRDPSFTCPACHRTSYHPEDVRHKYCGNCHEFFTK